MSYQPSAPFPGRRRNGAGQSSSGAIEPRGNRYPELEDVSYGEIGPYQPANAGQNRRSAEKTIAQIFLTLWRRKGVIAIATLLSAAIAYIISLQMEPRFMGQGVLAIETRPLYMPQLGTQQPFIPDTNLARSEAQILRSRELVESVARQLQLDRDPDLNPFLVEPTLYERVVHTVKAAAEVTASFLGLLPPRERHAADDADYVWAAVVGNVLRQLDVRTDGRSYVIYVDFDSASPQTAAAVVNKVMETFITRQIESSSKAMVDANAWVKERATELRREVEEADQKVQVFRTRHALVETRAGGTVSSQQLNEINTQLTLARAERAQAEARYSRAREEASSGVRGPEAATEVLASSLIARLREKESELIQREAEMSTRLGPGHPQRKATANELKDLRTNIDREIAKVLRSLQSQVEVARSREQTLERRLNDVQSRATTSAEAEVQLRGLEKEAETKRTVYQTFLATAQQTAEPSRINQANARIASTAIPPVDPFSPRKKLFVIVGLFIGFTMAAAAVLLFAELDRGFETTEDLEEATGIPALGAVPLVRGARKAGALTREVTDRPTSAVAETVRGIRIAMQSRLRRGNCPVVLVTSAEPGEGKTSLVSSLGFLGAQDGMRVLVVDSDLRRPRLHRLFRSPPAAGGLQDVLRGTQAWARAVRTDEASGADCLTAYDRTDSPVALLSSGHWNDFLRQARRVYDLIILDSPPVMKVADALTLSDYVDAVILVVAYRTTRRRTVQETLRRFASTGRPIFGAVLSKVSGNPAVQPYYTGYAPA